MAEKLASVLMGTQCTQCGYPSCEAYAAAMTEGEALPNRCRPGGAVVMWELQAVLGHEDKGLVLLELPAEPQVATVREEVCIGCTLCSQICPTDAVVGAARQRHTVLAADCTGCGLCVPVCPVDCIDLQAMVKGLQPGVGGAVAEVRRVTWGLVTAKRRRSERFKTTARHKPVTRGGAPTATGGEAFVVDEGLQQQIAAAREKARARHAHLAGRTLGRGPGTKGRGV